MNESVGWRGVSDGKKTAGKNLVTMSVKGDPFCTKISLACVTLPEVWRRSVKERNAAPASSDSLRRLRPL